MELSHQELAALHAERKRCFGIVQLAKQGGWPQEQALTPEARRYVESLLEWIGLAIIHGDEADFKRFEAAASSPDV